MTELPDSYDPNSIEPKWQDEWQERDVYRFDPSKSDTQYVIDTPPPYPSGNLHLGHALGWSYIDFVARYRRLKGDAVLFPQGWDCHGLPTEVKVEEVNDIHRTDVPSDEFREMCIDWTEDRIDEMKATMQELGFSQDWDSEYRTMDPEYWGKTQESFSEMADAGMVYRDEHPVNWCPRCETAIADAEVENIDREGTLHYVTFDGVDNGDIEIATTRPELLAACVGIVVSPDDDRYADRIGDTFEVPLFGQDVELLADDDVDADFGSGAVMVCTFGDKQDVEWWMDHDLDLRTVFTEDGHLNEAAGEFAGLAIDDAKTQVAEELDDQGYLNDTEPTEQSVGSCWRCDTAIEILSKEQWFVEVDQDRILDAAADAEWVPEHMHERLVEWTEGMDWDWVISRQRVFATPIPAWECNECGHWEIAGREQAPVDPTEDDPAVEACPECGGDDWAGETDVMDTWMDSSITPLHLSGWPEGTTLDEFESVDLRPQGHDIIRTWAFYTLLRTGALTDEQPWDDVLVNGMVFGEDGNKMSKSRGNFVQPDEAIAEYSADAVRQALALGGRPGSDVQFQWKEVKSASRFLTKLWNITKFSTGHFDEDTPAIQDPAYRDADRWLLSELSTVCEDVDEAMSEYRFDRALRSLREFAWEDLADDYVELVKGRLYNGRPGERAAAEHTLYTAVTAVTRLLAPFSPHATEEIWQSLPGTEGSVHAATFPSVEYRDADAELAGKRIAEVAREIRAWKSDQGMPLNADLDRVELYFDDSDDDAARLDTYDLSETVNAPIRLIDGRPGVELVPVDVDGDDSEIGPEFRSDAGTVMEAIAAADPAAIQAQIHSGDTVTVEADGESFDLDADWLTVTEEYRASSGEEVTVIEASFGTVIIYE
ncbi:valine--tRNA ligase [Halobacterium salinarum]|uniref:Valine--tRNA ligase n=1 Tax=Halobacterium salinarum (strain ATCC 33171 / DSM 3754 / JCM 8978 / NBRC 102687 / NCIMB 764 / 91-R6) TaxID=2597657 RepID=A0A4D6GTT6_HALS9|nr:valine--tRNA ligase [Halobacterium salinarum]MDL0121951.1 valine--tRNA ligase [Halobacterium salinarum]MDL0132339.1 valine--tRNA ligase [Halobacterium salinarum]QCC43858.1 valine--tRNA ligase [Halobacterium salinarum]TYO82352.1 valyl-tRNA synthetase [Halobacterium salinarum DSM 3754]